MSQTPEDDQTDRLAKPEGFVSWSEITGESVPIELEISDANTAPTQPHRPALDIDFDDLDATIVERGLQVTPTQPPEPDDVSKAGSVVEESGPKDLTISIFRDLTRFMRSSDGNLNDPAVAWLDDIIHEALQTYPDASVTAGALDVIAEYATKPKAEKLTLFHFLHIAASSMNRNRQQVAVPDGSADHITQANRLFAIARTHTKKGAMTAELAEEIMVLHHWYPAWGYASVESRQFMRRAMSYVAVDEDDSFDLGRLRGMLLAELHKHETPKEHVASLIDVCSSERGIPVARLSGGVLSGVGVHEVVLVGGDPDIRRNIYAPPSLNTISVQHGILDGNVTIPRGQTSSMDSQPIAVRFITHKAGSGFLPVNYVLREDRSSDPLTGVIGRDLMATIYIFDPSIKNLNRPDGTSLVGAILSELWPRDRLPPLLIGGPYGSVGAIILLAPVGRPM